MPSTSTLPRRVRFKSAGEVFIQLLLRANPTLVRADIERLMVKKLATPGQYKLILDPTPEDYPYGIQPLNREPDGNITLTVSGVTLSDVLTHIGYTSDTYYTDQIDALTSLLPEGLQGVYNETEDTLTISVKADQPTEFKLVDDTSISSLILVLPEPHTIRLFRREKVDLNGLITRRNNRNEVTLSTLDYIEPIPE